MWYFASITQNGLKVLVLCDSHVMQIRRNDCNKELKKGKNIFRSFMANPKQLDHYILPPLVDDETDAIIIHVYTNPELCKSPRHCA